MTLYGIWNPVKNEDEWTERRWMEQWPSQAALHRSMRERIAPSMRTPPEPNDFTAGNISPARHVFQADRPDAQFYGTYADSCIALYEHPDAERPVEIVEFGPRGGLRRRPYSVRPS
jgi:hypothetical protein